MEAVIQTTNQEEIEQAAASEDISIISVVGKTVEEAKELRQYIPERVRITWSWGNLHVGEPVFRMMHTRRKAVAKEAEMLTR